MVRRLVLLGAILALAVVGVIVLWRVSGSVEGRELTDSSSPVANAPDRDAGHAASAERYAADESAVEALVTPVSAVAWKDLPRTRDDVG